MKKVLLALMLVVVAGVLLWLFAFGGREQLAQGVAGPAPRLGRAFDAEPTVVLAGAEGLDGLARETSRLISLLPAETRAEFPPEMMDPELREQKLGFDPLSADGWRSIGIDPERGGGFALDTRFAKFLDGAPLPVLALAVTDRDKLLPALERLEVRAEVGTDPVAGEVVTVDGDRFLLGRRADFTMLVPAPASLSPDRLRELRETFDLFLKGERPTLAEDETYREAFDEIGGRPRYVFYGAAAPAVTLYQSRETLDPSAAAVAQFYTARFPALGLTFGPGGGGLRVLADAVAVKGLRQVFVPRRPAPKFSKLVPREGAMLLRFSLNLAELFDGVVAFVPPGQEAAKGQILLAKNMLPLALGASWDDLAAGYTGHFAVATTIPEGSAGPDPDEALVMAGVGDPAKADAVLSALLERALVQAPLATKEAIELRGHPGFRVNLPGGTAVTFVRIDDLLVAAMDSLRIEAALDRKETLAGTAAGDLLDGPAVLGFAVDVQALTRSLAQSGANVEGATELWKPYVRDGYLVGGAVVDEDGLLFGGEEGGGAMVAFMAGIGAAVAIPAFVKYVRRARTTEAVANVNRLYGAAVAYYAQHGAFPPPAGPTPDRPFCAGGAEKFPPEPRDWQQPTWQALDFRMAEAHYYRYEFAASGTGAGASFTARAVGDLDCDGVLSTFERSGTVTGAGDVEGGPLRRIMEQE